MLLKWLGIYMLIIKQREWIQELYFCWSFNKLDFQTNKHKYSLSNKQTSICTCITLYNCTIHCTKRTRAQSVRRQQRKRSSQESEMVNKHVTEVVRNMYVNHQAKRVDSRAILLLEL